MKKPETLVAVHTSDILINKKEIAGAVISKINCMKRASCRVIL